MGPFSLEERDTKITLLVNATIAGVAYEAGEVLSDCSPDTLRELRRLNAIVEVQEPAQEPEKASPPVVENGLQAMGGKPTQSTRKVR